MSTETQKFGNTTKREVRRWLDIHDIIGDEDDAGGLCQVGRFQPHPKVEGGAAGGDDGDDGADGGDGDGKAGGTTNGEDACRLCLIGRTSSSDVK